MTRLPFEDKDRDWLKQLREACEMPPQHAPHIGPPMLTRLVDTLLRQDEEIARLREDKEELIEALQAVEGQVLLEGQLGEIVSNALMSNEEP